MTVTKAVRNPGNFTVGPSDIYEGPYGCNKEDARDVGITQGGVSYSNELEFKEFDDADQYLGVIGLAKIGDRMEITFTMKENTLENMKLAWGLPDEALDVENNTLYFGASSKIEYKKLFIDGPAPGGGTANYEFWKTFPISASEVEQTKDDNAVYEVTMLVIEDTTKPEKYRYGKRVDVYDDTIPPAVDSILPVDSDTDVAVDIEVEWTFSEAIQQRDITTGNFNIVNTSGTEIEGELAYNPNDFTVTFTPESSLENDTLYLAFVSGEVRDMAGNAMGDNYRTSFTTVA
ncbi:Ig-like domain-containing protein [Halanaerobium congolense]|uniref:Ig-like domain-containing protein n=1 Tax=Halanaerobium congolense TaxID=54121 RepID=A0A1G8PT38_9FIRM|nr:Ig-like domain-containing protein [Halanaerobium congolense]SDI95592.1 Ig-like domain-containing protein [Halanaerobium congolense]SES90318.1 Ig-like domain-containing protein [Halanaerobium congolense]